MLIFHSISDQIVIGEQNFPWKNGHFYYIKYKIVLTKSDVSINNFVSVKDDLLFY